MYLYISFHSLLALVFVPVFIYTFIHAFIYTFFLSSIPVCLSLRDIVQTRTCAEQLEALSPGRGTELPSILAKKKETAAVASCMDTRDAERTLCFKQAACNR